MYCNWPVTLQDLLIICVVCLSVCLGGGMVLLSLLFLFLMLYTYF